jgi:hypothetical protein
MEEHVDAVADTPKQSKNSVSLLLFFFQSVVVAVLFPIVVGGSGGDVLITVWRLSLLLCSYFYSAVCVLSVTTDKARLFFTLTYVASMSFVVDVILSHAAGALIIYLDSIWNAFVFGQALAQRGGSGMSIAVTENPVPANEAEEKLFAVLFMITVFVILFFPCVILPMCIGMSDLDSDLTLTFIVAMSTMLCLTLPVAIIWALKPLRPGGDGNVVILGEGCGMGSVLFCWYLSAFILITMAFAMMSEVGAMLVVWICVLGLAVFLGYCHRLHACYVDIMRYHPQLIHK